jgi:hypothetical protein
MLSKYLTHTTTENEAVETHVNHTVTDVIVTSILDNKAHQLNLKHSITHVMPSMLIIGTLETLAIMCVVLFGHLPLLWTLGININTTIFLGLSIGFSIKRWVDGDRTLAVVLCAMCSTIMLMINHAALACMLLSVPLGPFANTVCIGLVSSAFALSDVIAALSWLCTSNTMTHQPKNTP